MALPVTDPAALSLRRLLHLALRPLPGRMGYSLRMAAACTSCVLIGEIWQIPETSLTAVVALAIWQKDRVTNAIAGAALSIVFAILLGLLYCCVLLTINHLIADVVAVALMSFGFFFLGSASKLKPVAYMLGLIMVYALIAIDQVPVGELVTRALLYAWLIIAVPGLVMIVLGLLICPSPKTVLTDSIALRLRMSAALLRGTDTATHQDAMDLLRGGTGPLFKNLKMAALEKIWAPSALARLKQAAISSTAILALADHIHRHERHSEDEARTQLAAVMEEMAVVFAEGDCPTDIAINIHAGDPAITEIALILQQFTTPSEESIPEEPKPAGFFFPDAFTNPDHVRFAVKGTAAVMTSYLIFKALDWDGIHTCIITCFIVALPTMGEMIAKLKLRISGALIGGIMAIASIIFLIPHFTNVVEFLVMIYAASFLAAWIKTGDARVAYAGLQIGLAFFLSDLKTFGPTADMTTARDRIIGILLGNFITYAVFTSFWPASASEHLGKEFGKIRTLLKSQVEASSRLSRMVFAARVQEAISATERTMENAAAEPVHMRTDTDRRKVRDTALRTASALTEDMLIPESPAPDHHFEQLEKVAS